MIVLHGCRVRGPVEHHACPGALARVAPAPGWAVCACRCHVEERTLGRVAKVLVGLAAPLLAGFASREPRALALLTSMLRDALDRARHGGHEPPAASSSQETPGADLEMAVAGGTSGAGRAPCLECAGQQRIPVKGPDDGGLATIACVACSPGAMCD